MQMFFFLYYLEEISYERLTEILKLKLSKTKHNGFSFWRFVFFLSEPNNAKIQ